MQTHEKILRPKILRPKIKKLTATLMSLFLVLTGFVTIENVVNAEAARAVADGPGTEIIIPGYGAHSVGAYVTGTGRKVYCLEIPRIVDRTQPNPSFTVPNTIPGFHQPYYYAGNWQVWDASVPALTKGSANYNKLAYLLGYYGGTNDGTKAAALQIAIWEIRDIGASAGHHQLLNNYRSVLPAHVNTLADSYVAEATAWVSNGGQVGSLVHPFTPPADPTISVTGAYSGTVSVSAGTNEITINNALFDSTGSNKIVWQNGAPAGTQVSWKAESPENYDRHFEVSVKGKWADPDGGLKIGEIHYSPGVLAPDGSTTQAVGYATSEHQPLAGNFEDKKVQVDTVWSPVLSTQVPSEFVEVGQNFADTVTFNVASSSNEWRRYKKGGKVHFAPITARGTLYGPFDTDPALNPRQTVPAGAPTAGTAQLTTDTAKGPGTYSVNPNITASKAGYYTWVWEIHAADQEGVNSIPNAYYFTDGFGQATEGQTVPMIPSIKTSLDRKMVRQNDPQIFDSVSVEILNGEWMKDGTGKRIPVNVRLSVYGTGEQVVQSPSVPAGAALIAESMVTVSAENAAVKSAAIVVPQEAFYDHQGVTVQACILRADQPAKNRPFFYETCDDYGVPSESAQFEWIPELYTNVTNKFINVGEDFNDTVTFHVKGLNAEESQQRGWRKIAGTDKYHSVTAQGVLYGPFDRDPVEFPSAEVPTYAKNRVAAAIGIVTDPEKGPGTYEISVPQALESGFYTWVWTIEHAGQTAHVQNTIPENYFYSDGFGSANESNVVTTTLELSTELNKKEVTFTDLHVSDSVRAKLLNGQWILHEGERVPAQVRLTLYGAKGDIVRQAEAPEEAKELTRGFVVLDRADHVEESAELEIAVEDYLEFDYVTVQACLLTEDQDPELQGYLQETCDDYGVPAESAVFIKPEVETQAQETAAVLDEIFDVAKVSGSGLPEGSIIKFRAYLKPELDAPKYDENWRPLTNDAGELERWSEEDILEFGDVCEAQPVAETETIEVNDVGEYKSPAVIARSEGTLYWVEELFIKNPHFKPLPEDESELDHESDLDDESEIGDGSETDDESEGAGESEAEDGQENDDSPEVDGEPDTDEENSVEEGDLDPNFESEESLESMEYLLLHRGECGLPNETTEIEEPVVASKAVTGVSAGNEIFDTAIVTGALSQREGVSYEVTFEAYHYDEHVSDPEEIVEDEQEDFRTVAALVTGSQFGENEGIETQITESNTGESLGAETNKYIDACTEDTKVWETNEPIVISAAGEYESPTWQTAEEHVGEILWVESLWRIETIDNKQERNLVHRGICGHVDEITKVVSPPVVEDPPVIEEPPVVQEPPVEETPPPVIKTPPVIKIPPLVETGSTMQLALVIASGLLLIVAGIAVQNRRSRKE